MLGKIDFHPCCKSIVHWIETKVKIGDPEHISLCLNELNFF